MINSKCLYSKTVRLINMIIKSVDCNVIKLNNVSNETYINPLQLSSILFIIPGMVALFNLYFFLGFILIINSCISIIVHRPSRLEKREKIDDVDNLFVGLWAFMNLLIIIYHPFETNMYFAIVCSIITVGLAIIRHNYKKKV